MTSFSFETVDPWVPSQGVHLKEGNWVVTIQEAEPATSKNGNAQIKLQLASDQGEKKDWLTYGGSEVGVQKLVGLFRGAGVQLLDSDAVEGVVKPEKVAQLVGKQVGVVLRDEPSFKDPSKVYAEVQGYLIPSEVKPLPGQGTAAVTAAPTNTDEIAF